MSRTFGNPPRLCGAAVLSALMVGCASTGFHYSEVDGRRFNTTNIDTYSVVIGRVDGRSPLVNDPPVRVDAGMRTIEVQGPPTPTNPGEFRSITLDVKVCTRYYLVAVKQSRLDNNFSVRIDREIPVPGCTPPSSK